MSNTQNAVPAGWYSDTEHAGWLRYWNGSEWTQNRQPIEPVQQPVSSRGPMTASALKVERKVNYVRQQKGHSLTKHLLLGVFVMWVPAIYYTFSPNHYWHA